jgi:hypothetical protein
VYVAAPLSSHRRHALSATETLEPARHLEEIRRMQEIAASRLGLGAAQRARQAAYLAGVEGKFAPLAAQKPKPAKTRRNIIASGGKV